MRAFRPAVVSGAASALSVGALLLAPVVTPVGAEARAAARGDSNAEDCVHPGPCEDGGEFGPGEGAEPEEPGAPAGEAGSGCQGACPDPRPEAAPRAATRAELSGPSSPPGAGAGRASARPADTSAGSTARAVASVRLARTGSETWLLAVLGVASAASGVGLLVLRRRRGQAR